MKKLVVLLLASLVATSAFGVADPDDNMMGIYFDLTADTYCLDTPASVPFMAYIILTHTTAPSINAYELGLTVGVPAGMEGMIFRLASTIANGVVSGVDVGTNGPLGGDFIVGLAAPLPGDPAVVLHSFQYMLLAVMPVEFYIGASSAPSIPGDFPVVQNADGSILMQVGQSTGGPGTPVALINSGCNVVGVEEASFGSVKSLFR
ncbi:MAG: hypothetical protein ABFS42_00920 [Candidatus Krumholzibacteriota bacterium]